MPRGRRPRTAEEPGSVKNVNTFMKRASICNTSRKGYNSNLNTMFHHYHHYHYRSIGSTIKACIRIK